MDKDQAIKNLESVLKGITAQGNDEVIFHFSITPSFPLPTSFVQGSFEALGLATLRPSTHATGKSITYQYTDLALILKKGGLNVPLTEAGEIELAREIEAEANGSFDFLAEGSIKERAPDVATDKKQAVENLSHICTVSSTGKDEVTFNLKISNYSELAQDILRDVFDKLGIDRTIRGDKTIAKSLTYNHENIAVTLAKAGLEVPLSKHLQKEVDRHLASENNAALNAELDKKPRLGSESAVDHLLSSRDRNPANWRS